MTTETQTPAADDAQAPAARRSTFRDAPTLRFGGILRSEWIKLTSIRSIGWAIAIAVVITGGIGALVALGTMVSAPEGAIEAGAFVDMPVAVLGSSGLLVSQLVFAILGVIAITGEYGSGQIRSSLTSVPSRLPMLGAKALVLGLIAFVASALALAAGMAATVGIGLAFGMETDQMVLDASVPFAMLGGATYLALLTVFALGVGALVRSAAGAIAIVLGLLLVLPSVLGFIPLDWVQDVAAFQLPAAGMTIAMPGAEATTDFWRDLAVTAAWPAAALLGAAAALRARDA